MKKLIIVFLLLSSNVFAVQPKKEEVKTGGAIVSGAIVGAIVGRIIDRTVGPSIDRAIDRVMEPIRNNNGMGPKQPGGPKQPMSRDWVTK